MILPRLSDLNRNVNVNLLEKVYTNKDYIIAFRKLVTVVLFYLFASLYYHYVEGWDTLICIYFITVTICTVGYGDYHPTEDRSRVFTIFVIMFGLVFIFSIINDFANFVLHYAEQKAAEIAKQKGLVKDQDPYRFVKKRAYSIGSILLLVLIGSFFFWKNEQWTFIQAIYWCICTTTTVGYGDLELKYDSSRLFLIFYIPISVCLVAGALGTLASISIEQAAEKKKLDNLNRKLDFSMIREMDTNGDGVDKCEFLVAMLVQMNVCNLEDDIAPWLTKFDQLDKDGSGKLDGDDIALLEAEEEERLRSLQGIHVKQSDIQLSPLSSVDKSNNA
eukprot:gene13294-17811_t